MLAAAIMDTAHAILLRDGCVGTVPLLVQENKLLPLGMVVCIDHRRAHALLCSFTEYCDAIAVVEERKHVHGHCGTCKDIIVVNIQSPCGEFTLESTFTRNASGQPSLLPDGTIGGWGSEYSLGKSCTFAGLFAHGQKARKKKKCYTL